jgi:hypothetical protein
MTTPSGEGEQIPMRTRSKYQIEDAIVNHELRRKLWDGQLPLKIELSTEDLFSTKTPNALYVRTPLIADYGASRKLLLLSACGSESDV